MPTLHQQPHNHVNIHTLLGMLAALGGLSTAGAQSLSDTYRLRNNPFGDALSSASGHFSTIQAELLLRFRN